VIGAADQLLGFSRTFAARMILHGKTHEKISCDKHARSPSLCLFSWAHQQLCLKYYHDVMLLAWSFLVN